jgi:hypothetical protein
MSSHTLIIITRNERYVFLSKPFSNVRLWNAVNEIHTWSISEDEFNKANGAPAWD